jgi:hypothetical protein
MASGHADGVGEAVSEKPENGSTRWQFRVPKLLARFIVYARDVIRKHPWPVSQRRGVSR